MSNSRVVVAVVVVFHVEVLVHVDLCPDRSGGRDRGVDQLRELESDESPNPQAWDTGQRVDQRGSDTPHVTRGETL